MMLQSNTMKLFCLVCVCLLLISAIHATTFVDTGAGISPAYNAASAWGDYDGDGDLDFITTGYSGTSRITKLYRNDSGVFTDTNSSIIAVQNGSVDWGDYDKDGDLDLLITGNTATNVQISRIYRNDNGTFVDIVAGLDGVCYSSASWGDYDNDGDLDILITGATNTSTLATIAKIYTNTNGVFSSTISFTGVWRSSAAWGDYDNDGDLDIVYTGATTGVAPFGSIFKLFRNDSGTFVDTSSTLPGAYFSALAWGDYDNDSDLDLLVSGHNGSSATAKLYRNDSGSFVDSAVSLTGVYSSNSAWSDYDNDGDLDIILTGTTGAPSIKVYNNNSGSFSEASYGLTAIYLGNATWGDYDNDGDLDLLLVGTSSTSPYTPIAKIYRNDGTAVNVSPSSPTNLRRYLSGNYVIFQWDAPYDDHTPSGNLTYALRIGTTSGGNDVIACLATSTGIRKKVVSGFANTCTWKVLKTVFNTTNTYFWSVQAIDGALRGSSFAQQATIPFLQVISPNGGETWKINETRTVYWANNPYLTSVNVYLSYDNGLNWTLINTGSINAALGSYSFVVPSVVSNQCLIKVLKTTTPFNFDVSDSTFNIVSTDIPYVNLLTPDTANLKLIIGSVTNITWSSSLVSNVNLELSNDNGYTWTTIASSIPASLGTYAWTVPDFLTEMSFIRISDSSNSDIYDWNNNSFKICRLRILSPNGGNLFLRGSTQTVTWVSSFNAALKLEYSFNNGSSWSSIANSISASVFSYSWTIPGSATPSNQYLLRLSLTSDATLIDQTDSTFTVSSLALTYPSATSIRLQAGKVYNITWSQQCLSTNLKLEYSIDNGTSYTLISSTVSPGAGTYAWTVPAVSSSLCLIRISLVADPNISDSSDNLFAICSLQLSAPNGNEVFDVGTSQTITWSSSNVTNVRLEYTTNNGSTWTTIIASVSATPSTYSWTIPTLISYECKVRISDVSALTVVNDVSDNLFTIRTPIIVTAPNGGESLTVGSSYNIRWTVTASVSFILIDYSINNGSTWIAVVSTAYPAASGTYTWTVPGTVSNNCLVKVKKSTDVNVNDVSNSLFIITPTIFPPTAQFQADITEGLEPLTVVFTDLSTPGSGTINSWLWNFGDNSTSSIQNPTHIFQNSGVYSVSLTVRNVYDSTRTLTKQNYITVNSRFPIVTLLTPAQVSFGNILIGNSSSWSAIRYQNIGLTALSLDSLALNGQSGFSYYRNNTSNSIAPSQIDTIFVKFTPDLLGEVSNTLHIYNSSSNDPDLEVLLTGTGLALHVPNQYSTIQAAIDAASEGNCIIVEEGVYYENVQIVGKQITLASNYFVDGDSTHVSNTIIDGSQVSDPDKASVIGILPGNNPYMSPKIIGFTIRNGRGWKITETMGSSIVEKRAGGGIYINQSNPVLTRNVIVDNEAEDEGGGSYAFQSLPNLGGMDHDGIVNPGGNVFIRNRADVGKDLYVNASHTREEIKAENCQFEVFSIADTTLSSYWATTTNPVKYSGSQGDHAAINADLYVATDGNNETNTGLTPESPYQSIDYALSLAYGTEENPVTIYLASGIYSSDFTGEKFPLQMVKWVSLKGNGKENTIIDAGANSQFPTRVITSDNVVGVTIEDLTLINGYVTNTKNLNGGGLAVLNSQISLSNVAINNSFSAGGGAGFYAYNSYVDADSLAIEYNQATGSGGGVYSDMSDLTISNSIMSHNLTFKYGGGIYHNAGHLELNNNLIQYNNANGVQMRGGGISLTSTTSPVLSNNTISSNSGYNGGGISMQNCTSVKISGNKIVNNVATNWGGGVYHVTTLGNFYNNLIANNTASQRGGGFYSNSSVNLTNCTISNNRAYSQGGAMYCINCSPNVINSILWNNSAPTGNEVYLYDNSSSPNIRYSDVNGGSSAFGKNSGVTYNGTYTNNLNVDPLFVTPTSSYGNSYDALSADWTLQITSPCINVGDPTTETTEFPTDLGGLPRIISTIIDLGAYETVDIGCAIISISPSEQVNFGQSILNGPVVSRELIVTNTGTQPLIITGISFQNPDSLFQWTFGQIDQEIQPNQSDTIFVTFNPAELGIHSTTVLIQNNSLNFPTASITLQSSVIGETSTTQGNIHLSIVNYSAHLNWAPINIDEEGNPFVPDTYLVLYSENDSIYFFHGATADTTYIHYDVARHRTQMFYKVVAVANVSRYALNDLILRSRQSAVIWNEVKYLFNYKKE